MESAKKPMPRFAFSEPSMGSITTNVAPSPIDAGFFGNDRQTVDLFEPSEDRALGCRVDRRCLVAALAGADDRLTVGAQRQLDEHAAHVLDRRAAEAEPVSQAGGRAGPR